MANTTANIDIGLSPQSLNRIEADLAKALGAGVTKGIGGQGFGRAYTQAMGSMTAATRSFDSTLQTTNRRVIGFGISLGLIGGAVKGFREIISATREVDAAMAKIASQAALTTRQLTTLQGSLFDVARKTGQSFDEAARSFAEFSKLGTGVDQTLRNATNAMGLAKVGAIDAADATKELIAAFITFRGAGEDVASIANKISAATRTFPGSIKGSLDALDKFGQQAQDAGISLNRLLGIITAVQARTAASGQSIGSTFERIFARLQNPANLQKLQGIPGLSILDDTGKAKQGIALFDEIIRKYAQLSDAQKNLVSQTIGGSFGSAANITKVLLADLNSANGLASQVTKNVAQATNDLNSRLTIQTNNLDQQIQNLGTTAKQVGSIIGKFTLTPALNNLVGAGNLAGKLFTGIQGTGIGATIGQDILKGIGNVISGPGLILISRVLGGALSRTFSESIKDLKQIGGFGGVSTNEQAVLRGVNTALSQATEQERRRFQAAQSVREQEQIILGILERQVSVTTQLAGRNLTLLEGVGAGALRGRLAEVGGAAGGYLPGVSGAISAENSAISRGVGGAPSSARSVYLPNVAGGLVANSSEWKVPMGGQTAIFNREMIHAHGLPPGSVPVAAGGYVPNMAGGSLNKQPGDTYSYGGRWYKDLQDRFATEAGASSGSKGGTFASGSLQRGGYGSSFLPSALSKISGPEIDNLNKLFDQIHKAGSIESAQPAYQQVQKLTKSLDDLSKQKVFARLDEEIQLFTTRQGRALKSVASAPYFDYGASGGSSSYTTPTGGGLDYSGTGNRGPRGTPKPSWITRLEADAASGKATRAAQKAASEAAFASAARRQRFGARLQNAALISSFAGGFIPEGEGGTFAGQRNGLFSGALQGFGVGAGIGAILGPEAAVVGGIIGAGYGAFQGLSSKRTHSFQELSGGVQSRGALNSQRVQGFNQYIQAVDDLRTAQTNGASPDVQRRLFTALTTSFTSLSPDIQRQAISAGYDPNKLADISTSLYSAANKGGSIDTTILGAASLAEGKNGITSGDISSSLFSVLQGSNRGFSATDFRAGGSQQNVIAKIRNLASTNSEATPEQLNELTAQLGRLDFNTLFKILGDLGKAWGANKDNIAQIGTFAKSNINYADLKSQLTDGIASIQAALDATSNLKQYVAQQTGQRVGAATRILGSGRLRGSSLKGLGGMFGGGTLGAQDIEGAFRLQSVQGEVGIANDQALAKAKDVFATRASGNLSTAFGNTQGPEAQALVNSIFGAKSAGDLQKLIGSIGLEGKDKQLQQVVDEVRKQSAQGERQIQLVKDEIVLQRLELQSQQQANLLLRGGFNASRASGYVLGGGSVGVGAFGPINAANAALGQSEALDQMGIFAGPNTASYQYGLRKTSTLGNIHTILARRLGRPVGTDIDSLQGAAQRLPNSEEGNRFFDSLESLRTFNPQKVAQGILTNPGGLGLSDIQGAISQGQISLGDAAIIGGVTTSNSLLSNIDKNIAGLTGGASTSGGSGGSGVTNLGVLVRHQGPFQGTSADTRTYHQIARDNVTSSNNIGAGFAFGLSDLQEKIQSLGQIGYQVAGGLSSSFGNFFASFASGAEKGRNAFRSFASSILADASRLFATNAFNAGFSALGGLLDPAARHASGGFVGLAAGGSVPVMLTGGEYVFSPEQARAIGPRALQSLNAGRRGYAAGGGIVQGGSGVMDDVPAMARPGSFVIKKSAVQSLGAGYLNSFSSRFQKHDYGDYVFGNNSTLPNGSSLQYGNQFGGSPVSTSSAIQSSVLGSFGASVALFGLTAALQYLLAPSDKVLDTPGISRNAANIQADQAGYIANRPAGSFVDAVKGPDGRYHIIDYTGPASEYNYSNGQGQQATFAAAGGSIGGGSPSYLPVGGDNATVTNVTPTITIHNYGGGNVSSNTTQGSNNSNNPFGGADFANRLDKYVKAAVNEQLVQGMRPGGLLQTRQRYVTNPYGS